MVGPPDLVVGGGDDLAGDLVRDRAPQRGVQMRCGAFLRFHRREVLHLPAQDAPQVLHQAVHQRGEVDRIPRGAPVVVGVRVHGCAVADRAVAVAGEGQKHRRPVLPGVLAPDRRFAHLPGGQIGGVLASSGGTRARRLLAGTSGDGIRPRIPGRTEVVVDGMNFLPQLFGSGLLALLARRPVRDDQIRAVGEQLSSATRSERWVAG